MRRLFTALGVDYGQWKALTIAALKLDVRVSAYARMRSGKKASGARSILGQVVFYGLTGVFMALMVSWLEDRFAAATLLFSYVILMVGLAMLVEHNTAITSPTDYGTLGFQPITSRTYFASKLTNALVYTLGMTTALGILPTGVLAAKYGIGVGAAAVLALYACAGTVTLAIVTGYVFLMRTVGARRLRSTLSYLQMVMGFLVYGGYFLVTGVASKSALSGFHLTRTPWLMLYPGTWFASYLEVAAGSARVVDLVPVLASLGLGAFLLTRLRGRLSLEYAAQLAALATSTGPTVPAAPGSGPRPGWWFRRGEARATAILVRSHFRNDLKFRMGVLGVLPLTVLYLIMGLADRRPETAGAHGVNLSLVTVAIMLFPVLLKINLGHSDAFRASWIFFASPGDRTRLIRSSKNILMAFFVIPYLALVGATLAVFTHDLAFIVVYVFLAGLLSHLGLLVAILVDPELPFSKPTERGRSSSRLLLTMIVVSVMGGLVPVLVGGVYGNALATVVGFAAVIAVTLVLSYLTRLRIEARAARLEFQG